MVGLDAISGATVTVIAQNQVMMRSGGAVARQTGILAPTVRRRRSSPTPAGTLDWAPSPRKAAVQRLDRAGAVGPARASEPFIELWFGT